MIDLMWVALSKLLSRKYSMNPIFVVGSYRSGTSILLQALGKHPYIMSAKGEAPLISFSGEYISAFESSDPVQNKYLNVSNKISKDYIYDYHRRLNFEISFGNNYGIRQNLKSLINNKYKFLNKKFWSAKVFPDQNSYRGLEFLYPNVKFVYIVRNGIDVVESRRHFAGFKHESFESHCLNWVRDCQKFRYLESSHNAVHVYYEQLLENSELFFDNIFDSLSISKSIEPSQYSRENLIHPLDQGDKRGVDAINILKSRAQPYEGWSDEEKSTFLNICTDEMKYHGYTIPFG